MQDNFLTKQYHQFLEQLRKNPQLLLLYQNFLAFWTRYGRQFKIILIVALAILIVFLSIRFGSTLANLFRPTPVTPPSIPSLTPTPINTMTSKLQQIQSELKSFNILLPDPAPPAVDSEIHLNSLPLQDD